MASIHHHLNEGKANKNQMNWADPTSQSEDFVGPVRGQLPAGFFGSYAFCRHTIIFRCCETASDSKKQQAKDKDREEETRRRRCVRLAPFQPTGPQSRRPKM